MATRKFLDNAGLIEVLQKLKQTFSLTNHTHSGYAAANHTHTYSDVGAAAANHTHSGYVPTSRTVNNKALSSDITLNASDVGAAASNHTHSEYAAANHTHTNYVPTTRTVNNKALSSDISLTAYDVGAISRELRQVTIAQSGWTSSNGKYTQRITKDTNGNSLSYTANSTPIMGKCASSSWTSSQMESYNTAFNIVCRGMAETGAGYVEFTAYALPARSIDVILKGE